MAGFYPIGLYLASFFVTYKQKWVELVTAVSIVCSTLCQLMWSHLMEYMQKYDRVLLTQDDLLIVEKRKTAGFILQVIILSLDMLGICVLLKLSYYLVNGHHATLADGHKECQKPGLCIIFKYGCPEIYDILSATFELETDSERTLAHSGACEIIDNILICWRWRWYDKGRYRSWTSLDLFITISMSCLITRSLF